MFKRLAQRLRAQAGTAPERAAILDVYVRKAPDPQNALDIFKGEWWSALPEPWSHLQAGQLPVAQDPRIQFAIDAQGGVAGKAVLELGPLEGGHTYMLEKAGARSVIAVEANTRAYLKCLIAKEVMGLQRSSFLLGDFEDYLRAGGRRFDTVIACGVLYHMRNPVELLHNIARMTDCVYVWTQYYVKERLEKIPHMAHRWGESRQAEHDGFRHTLHRYNYGDFLNTTRFAGGSDEYSHWLSREDLLGALRHAGLTDIQVGEDDLEHTNGPCISLLARRPRG